MQCMAAMRISSWLQYKSAQKVAGTGYTYTGGKGGQADPGNDRTRLGAVSA